MTQPATTTRIPSLRFPEFNGGWEEKEIIDFAPLQRGFDLPVSEINLGAYPVVFSNGILKFHNKYKVVGPGVVTGRSGTIGNVTFVEDNYWPHNTSLWVTDFNNNYPKFVYYFYVHLDLTKFSSGSGVPTLNRNDVHKHIIHITDNIHEQTKIAAFLSSVDTKIDQLSQKKALLEQYKKGVMQQIFSQQIRFKADDGGEYPEWEEKKLGEVGTTYNGLTGKTADDFGDGFPYIQYKQIFDKSKIDVSKFGFVSIGENDKQNMVCYGDIFFTVSSETPNEVGYASVLLDDVDNLYLNSFCFGYRPNKLLLDSSFSQYLFRSNKFRKKVIPLAQGSTRYNISKTEFIKLTVMLPCLEEQTKIANFLSAIDSKIEQVAQQLEAAKQFKKGLLQQMFV